jgi:hypothetical protein
MFAFALPTGLLLLLLPFMICSETPKAAAFDLNDGVCVMWIQHFCGCKTFASFHCFTPHFPTPLYG